MGTKSLVQRVSVVSHFHGDRRRRLAIIGPDMAFYVPLKRLAFLIATIATFATIATAVGQDLADVPIPASRPPPTPVSTEPVVAEQPAVTLEVPLPRRRPQPGEVPIATAALAGCGYPAPASVPTLRVSGRSRSFILALPDDYDPSRRHRLILAFHGRTNSAAQVQRYYGLEGRGALPAIVVYPRGLQQSSGRFVWWNGGNGTSDADFVFFDALLDYLTASYCIDEHQVFAVGHSMGGSFVNSLACARGDALRAVAVVGGGYGGAPGCRGQVAALVMHHPDDRLVPVAAGEAAREARLAQNGLEGQVPWPQAAPSGFQCERYGVGSSVEPVIWCPHPFDRTRSGRYYPHNWPAGTGAAIIDFFDRLPAR